MAPELDLMMEWYLFAFLRGYYSIDEYSRGIAAKVICSLKQGGRVIAVPPRPDGSRDPN